MRAQVLSALRREGPRTAVQVRQSMGLTHDQVYQALISLEALGLAEVAGTKFKRTIKWKATHGIQKPAPSKSNGIAPVAA